MTPISRKMLPSRGRKLWIFDFDGTLSPLVEKRDAAAIHPECEKLLRHLSNRENNVVAILSSRTLDDLCSRVSLSRIFLGGGSGTVWQTPDKRRIHLGPEIERRLERARSLLLCPLRETALLPGVEMEDKKWSIALHFRKATAVRRSQLLARIELLRRFHDINFTSGPDVVEVQLLPEINKAFGVRTLCRMVRLDVSKGRIFYAGDDENDAIAMRWVNGIGGTVMTIGEKPLVPDTAAVKDPQSLAREVLRLAEFDGRRKTSSSDEPKTGRHQQGQGVRQPETKSRHTPAVRASDEYLS